MRKPYKREEIRSLKKNIITLYQPEISVEYENYFAYLKISLPINIYSNDNEMS
jgi:hypothetical protein